MQKFKTTQIPLFINDKQIQNIKKYKTKIQTRTFFLINNRQIQEQNTKYTKIQTENIFSKNKY